MSAQTFHDWEIIVVDDGSSDRTADIAEAHASKPIVMRNAATGGLGAARNTAIDASSGELLALLDADDYWHEAYLQQQTSVYDAHGGHAGKVGVVACDARILGAGGFRPYTYMDYVGCPEDVRLSQLLVSNPVFVSVLTTRAAIDEAGGFATDLLGVEDHDLWIRLTELGYRIVVERRTLAVYRLGSASLSSNAARMARYEARVFERALARGNLRPYERRLARRSLRRRRVTERILGDDGISYAKVIKALPLLVLVAAEDPGTWRSIPRLVRQGRNALSTRFATLRTGRRRA